MRSFDGATAAHFATASDFDCHILFWMTVRHRTTGAAVNVGLWTGDDVQAFTIDGVARTYQGAGAIMGLPALTYESGLSVRNFAFTLAGMAPEVAEALRFYEPRLAPVEVHRALFVPESGALVAAPYRLLSGVVDDVTISTPATGGQGSATVSVASSARRLTQSLPLYKSDEQQRLRGGDRFRRWNDISGSVDVVWGQLRGGVAPPPAPKPPPLPPGKPPGWEGGQ